MISQITRASGWALSAISELDITAPGIAGFYLRSGDERRQVIAAYLSLLPAVDRRNVTLPSDPSARSHIADLLWHGDHHSILQRAFGEVPVGFRRALSRTGSESQRPLFYRMLWRLLRDRKVEGIARVIHHLAEVTLPSLVIACILPNELRHPLMIDRLSHASEARDISLVTALLRDRVIDKDAFSHAMKTLARGGDMQEFVQRWLLRAWFARSPLIETDRLHPIHDGITLRRCALSYRNCSVRYAADLLEGRAALAAYDGPHGKAMILLAKRADEWTLSGIFGPRNEEPDEQTHSEIMALLKKQRIGDAQRSFSKDSPFVALRRLSSRTMFAG